MKRRKKSKSTRRSESKDALPTVSLHYTSLSAQIKAPYFDPRGRQGFHPRSGIALFDTTAETEVPNAYQVAHILEIVNKKNELFIDMRLARFCARGLCCITGQPSPKYTSNRIFVLSLAY